MNKSPCKDCKKRKAGCHINCADEQEYKAMVKPIEDRIRDEKNLNNMLNTVSFDGILRMRRGKVKSV